MDELPSLLNRLADQLMRIQAPVAALLRPGLSVDAIERRVKDLPFRLPREIYILYQWRDGVPADRYDTTLFSGSFAGWVFHSLEDALALYREQIRIAHEIGKANWTTLWHPRWFPLFESDVPTYLCMLGQEREAETAPLLYVDVEDNAHDEEYASLTQLMRIVVECYESGAYVHTAEGELEADVGRVGAVRRRHQAQRANAAIAALQRGASDPTYARAVNDAIAFHDTRAVEPLLRALAQSDNTDSGAMVALADLGDERTLGLLLRAVREGPVMDSVNRSRRGMAAKVAEALHYMDTPGARRSYARDAALQAIVPLAERLHVPLPVEPFALALRDPLTFVRRRAVWVLERIATAEARDALRAALDDPDENVRQTIQQALERIWPIE